MARPSQKHPEESAGPIATILVSWITPLIVLASKRRLEEADVWDCPEKQSVEHCAKQVWQAWQREKTAAALADRPASTARAMWCAFRADILFAGSFQLLFLISQLGQPYLVGQLVSHVVTGEGGVGFGVGLAIALAIVSLCSSLSLAYTLFLNRRLGVAVRSGVMAAVYSHSLALTSAARLKTTTGSITNLLSVDSEKLFLAAQFAHFAWHGPIASFIVMCLLIPQVGFLSALAGFGWLILLIPAQSYIAGRIGAVRRGMIMITDERVKLTNEILTSIRAIKLYGWELPLQHRILSERGKELKQLQSYLLNSAHLRELLFAAGPIATVIIFVVHVYTLRESIGVAQVFTVLAFINILRFPLNLLGQALKCFSDAAVSCQRLDRFFSLPVLAGLDISVTSADAGLKASADASSFSSSSSSSISSLSSKGTTTAYININNATFTWDDDAEHNSGSGGGFRLQDITFTARADANRGELIAVIGAVGCGKSSLFSAILNELPMLGSPPTALQREGSIAYCAQTPWIQNLTLQANILFGLSKEGEGVGEAYDKAVFAAALLPDLAMLPHGDATEIGERGITLSGGQKARVAIARALLSALTGNASILLCDDILSAVDSTTAHHIFQHGIQGLCRDKLVMVALNSHLHLLSHFDRIIVMDGGRVACEGTMKEVWATAKGREVFLQAGLTEGECGPVVEVDSTTPSPPPPPSLPPLPPLAEVKADVNINDKTISAKEGKLIQTETRATGAVSYSAYLAYFSSGFDTVAPLTPETIYTGVKHKRDWARTAGGVFVGVVLLLLFAITQGFRIAVDYCLAAWASHRPFDPQSIWGYAYFVSLGCMFVLLGLRSAWLNHFSVCSAEAIHKEVFTRIMQAPINRFFDVTPMGGVLNRLSKDTEIMDSSVPEFMLQVLINWATVGSIFALAIWAAPYLLMLLFPMSYGFFRLYKLFSAVSRDLKRLEGVTRSPIFSSLSETLSGLDTIRAYGATQRFLTTHRRVMGRNQRIYFHLWLAMSWVTARLEIATSIILFAVAILCVTLRESSDPVSLGLALSFALQLTALFQRCIQVAIDVSTYMTSVERVLELGKLDIEHSVRRPALPVVAVAVAGADPDNASGADADAVVVAETALGRSASSSRTGYSPLPTSSASIPPDWPSEGVVSFSKVSMRYRDNTPLVLKEVSFRTKAGERIGICGRTGSGKSSLLVALCRTVELDSGSITIDGYNTQDVPLAVLRGRMAIIPQDPVLLTGSLRFQLDPFSSHTDAEILEALEMCNLKDIVSQLPLGLLEPIFEGGENLSHGTRQLLCIARALLRRNRILVIDEGTSSVDPQTDAVIQATLRRVSAEQRLTVLCIAHRLSTILDFDRVLVLADGRVREFDAPSVLQAREGSLFAAMVRSNGL